MTRSPKIGLLPFYLELYDKSLPEWRGTLEPFLRGVGRQFGARGIEAVTADICRLAPEFRAAVDRFEKEDVDCIVTLHLAYSPSLESIGALVETTLPILILDTTMDAAFGLDAAPERIAFNHGIHGVMDMACMLRRRSKPFRVVAGHIETSNVMDRAADCVRGAYAARCLRETRALRIGESFHGMGDFSVEEEVMARELGIVVEQITAADLARDAENVTRAQIQEEIERDRKRFDCKASDPVHERSVRVALALRRRLAESGCSAFSMNFLAFDRPAGPVNTPPFLEASKAMSRGIGYAGEGDVLTAALVGALIRGFGAATFTEIFCPDWAGESIFLSHMGEINPEVAASRPRLVEKEFPFTPAQNPVVLACAPRPGPAVFVNLAPEPSGTFRLILSAVDVLDDTTDENMRDVIRGWIRPKKPLTEFLEAYSRNGGTHHSALVLGDRLEGIEAFADFARLQSVLI